MVKFMESEFSHLRGRIDEMWALVAAQMGHTRDALLKMDHSLAQGVVAREKRINAFELKIDSDVEDLIALYAPVAIDLRFTLAVLKINTNLERIGDFADGISRFVINAPQGPLDAKLVEELQLGTMFSQVLSMLELTRGALQQENAELASGIFEMDSVLDNIYAASPSILAAYTTEDPSRIKFALELSGVLRKLERSGDHLTNIAEEIVFYVNAKVLKHKGGK